jgi:hypothetical protein
MNILLGEPLYVCSDLNSNMAGDPAPFDSHAKATAPPQEGYEPAAVSVPDARGRDRNRLRCTAFQYIFVI